MVVVGELLAGAVVKKVCDKLGDAAIKWIASQLNFSKDLDRIKDNLLFIQSVLKDAERRSSKENSVRDWLKRLKAAAYDLEDMLLFYHSFISDYEDEDVQDDGTSTRRMILTLGAKIPKELRALFERSKMPDKVKSMNGRIQEIVDLNKFNFRQGASNDDDEVFRRRITFSGTREVTVGRLDEKERIIGLLQEDGPFVVSIHGFGGVGKTTLARMVFNDERTRELFEGKAWVYVSLKFDIQAICQNIISQLHIATASATIATNTGSVDGHLRTIISEKRFLLVLDDLWEECTSELEVLMKLLQGGKAGSKVIATTRFENVAKMVNGINFPIRLDPLSFSYCCALFRAMVFPPGTTVDPDKERIGKQIVEKCKGVPMAVEALGTLCLRYSNHWEAIRDNDIWAEDAHDGPLKETKVLPSLKLSYHYMPSYLKPCFAYCTVLPKGRNIDKSSLIQQWIALGFIQLTPDQRGLTAQTLGELYFEELIGMSFFQDVAGTSPTEACHVLALVVVSCWRKSKQVRLPPGTGQNTNTDGNQSNE